MFFGDSNQTVTSTVIQGQNELPNVVINKTGGTATFTGIFSMQGSWFYQQGGLDMTTNNADLVFINENQSINGTHSINNLILALEGGANFTVNDTTTILGDLTIEGANRTDIEGATGALFATNDIFLNNTATNAQGLGNVVLSGSNAQLVVSSVGVNTCELPNFWINKSGGTASFDGLISLFGDFNYVAGTTDFSTLDSKICFTNRNQELTGNVTLHKMRVDFRTGGGDLDVQDTVIITDTLELVGTQRVDLDGPGELHAQGDLYLDMTRTDNRGNGTIRINGTTNQKILSTAAIELGEVPSVIIDKTGGTASFEGIISVEDNWTYLQGNTDYATDSATIAFTAANQVVSGINDFWNLTFEHNGNGDIDVTDTLNVFGDFLFSSVSETDMDGGGVINCFRDFTINNTSTRNDGTVLIRLVGTNDQSINGNATIGRGEIPNFEIAKTGGTASFDGTISMFNDWTYTSGTTDYATDSATVAFTSRNQVISGNNQLFNLILNFNGGGDFDVNDTTEIYGTFSLIGAQRTDIDGPGVLEAFGDISVTNTSGGNSGNGLIRIIGTGTQTVNSTSLIERGEIPNLEIVKTGGSVSFDGILSVFGDWTYTSGTTDYATDSATIAFTNRNHVLSGENEFFNLSLEFNNGGDFDVSDTNDVFGLVTLSSNQGTDIDGPGVLNLHGDLSLVNTSGGNDGNGLLRIIGTGNQNVVSTSGFELAEIPSIAIDKPSGTESFDGIISVYGSWEYVAGTVDMTTDSTLVVFNSPNNFIDGEGNSGTMTFFDIELGDGNRYDLQ